MLLWPLGGGKYFLVENFHERNTERPPTQELGSLNRRTGDGQMATGNRQQWIISGFNSILFRNLVKFLMCFANQVANNWSWRLFIGETHEENILMVKLVKPDMDKQRGKLLCSDEIWLHQILCYQIFIMILYIIIGTILKFNFSRSWMSNLLFYHQMCHQSLPLISRWRSYSVVTD
jgi:hypothetical protein